MRRFQADMARAARSVSQLWVETLQMRATVCQSGACADQYGGANRSRLP